LLIKAFKTQEEEEELELNRFKVLENNCEEIENQLNESIDEPILDMRSPSARMCYLNDFYLQHLINKNKKIQADWRKYIRQVKENSEYLKVSFEHFMNRIKKHMSKQSHK